MSDDGIGLHPAGAVRDRSDSRQDEDGWCEWLSGAPASEAAIELEDDRRLIRSALDWLSQSLAGGEQPDGTGALPAELRAAGVLRDLGAMIAGDGGSENERGTD